MLEIIILFTLNNNGSPECFLKERRCQEYSVVRVNKSNSEKMVSGLNVLPPLGKKDLPPVLETFTPKTSNR